MESQELLREPKRFVCEHCGQWLIHATIGHVDHYGRALCVDCYKREMREVEEFFGNHLT